ncbi:unnamed protein product [Cladocopium goreaui]|uniref:Dynein heavy chain 6, axonemal n=1 Tax=Cladocopium goreaui TaxID=2562237 RepID=A0A9P1BUM9_9DINO|nr:unnamed protein product [Cladocopium goreaui]
MELSSIFYNLLLGAPEEWRKSFLLLQEMRQEEIETSVVSFSTVMRPAAETDGGWRMAWTLLRSMHFSVRLDAISYSSAMPKAARWPLVLALTSQLRCALGTEDVVLCSDAARCCARPEGLEGPEGRWWRAMEMLTAARKRGVEMNALALSAACAQWIDGLQLLSSSRRGRMAVSRVVQGMAQDTCGKAEQWRWAMRIFEAERLDPVGCSSCISACKHWRMALTFLETSNCLGLEASIECLNAAAASSGRWTWPTALRRLLDVKLQASLVTFNQALQLPAWQKSLQLREKLEMSQLEPDQVTVTSLVSTLGQGLQWQLAMLLKPEASTKARGAIASISSWREALMEARSCRPVISSILPRLWPKWRTAGQVLKDLTDLGSLQVATYGAAALSLGSSSWRWPLQLLRDMASQGLVANALSLNSALAGGRFPWPRALQLAMCGASNDYVVNSALACMARSTKRAMMGNPEAVQEHLCKCFDAISFVTFTEEKKKDIIDMNDMIKEKVHDTVPFTTPVQTSGSPVEKWLGDIEQRMVESLHAVTKAAVGAYPEDGIIRKDWLFGPFPAQSALAVDQIMWTSCAEEALNQVEAGDAEAMKRNIAFTNKQKEHSVDLVRLDLTKLQRVLMGALIVLDVHGISVLEQIEAAKCRSVNDFDWSKQLRYYWALEDVCSYAWSLGKCHRSDGTKASDTCIVKQTIANIRYSFEYLGNTPRLVVTPLTDKHLSSVAFVNWAGGPQNLGGPVSIYIYIYIYIYIGVGIKKK